MTTRLPMSEIESMLSEIARDEDSGADRFRALKMLAGMSTSLVTLEQPYSDAEVIERLYPLMKCAGVENTQKAFHRAFPRTVQHIDNSPRYLLADLPEDLQKKANWCISLKRLNKAFPELKKNGFWPGFPQGAGDETRRDWCRKTAAQILLDRYQRERDFGADVIEETTEGTGAEEAAADPDPGEAQ